MSFAPLKIDKSWSLFLDRDGVINRRIPGDYVKSWEQFEFLPGVLDAFREFSPLFGRIFIVSNQQGIGKGLMMEDDLKLIHDRMILEIRKAGGKLDKVYHCPDLEESHSIMRKPGIGMALHARRDFPGISFKRSLMVGDSIIDMVFGKRLRMKTVLICDDLNVIRKAANLTDLAFPDILSFVAYLKGI